MNDDELVNTAEEGDTILPNRIGIHIRLINLFGTMAIAGSIFSLAASQSWLADLAVQFRVQYLIILLPAIVVWVGNSDPDQTSFRILVVNVLRTNESLNATLDEILKENADFVFLMEVGPAWKSPLEGLVDRYPHQKLICRDDYTGVAFLSRYAWDHLEVVNKKFPIMDFEGNTIFRRTSSGYPEASFNIHRTRESYSEGCRRTQCQLIGRSCIG